jgi:hypothetical protein
VLKKSNYQAFDGFELPTMFDTAPITTAYSCEKGKLTTLASLHSVPQHAEDIFFQLKTKFLTADDMIQIHWVLLHLACSF